MKSALFVIDVQKAYFDAQTNDSLNNAIEYINAAIALFRTKGSPVISIQHMNREEGHVPGSKGFDLPESLQINPDDLHIHKEYGNAFNKTPLAAELKKMGVDTVILTGFCAEYCVLSTYHGAKDLDLTPILLRNSLASPSARNIRFVESISEVISLHALEKFMS
ncbi:MAG: isochorismatase family protein [Anaerolineaceae bacterium]|nr:isochorismatase family protein [Anaerolineaceae bacterium]